MARSSQNTTINHHDDRRKTQQSTIMKAICCTDEPTEERDAAMARSSQNTTINHHEGHLLSRRANGGLQTQQSTITKATGRGRKHNNQPLSRRPRSSDPATTCLAAAMTTTTTSMLVGVAGRGAEEDITIINVMMQQPTRGKNLGREGVN